MIKLKNFFDGKDLAKFIADHGLTISCAESRRLIVRGHIKVNGKTTHRVSHQLHERDEVEIDVKGR